MDAQVTARSDKSFKLEIEIPLSMNMLEAEELIQQALNLGGVLATEEAMKQHDTDGSPIIVCGQKLTTKGQESKKFQTPYGAIEIERHVYQSTKGGSTYAPMDDGCRVIGTSTPKFAKMVTSKYACDAAPGVQRDLEDNHNRPIALSFIKNITDTVGSIAQAKEENWNYELPEMPSPVKSISIGLDGTCLNMQEDGWREAMCGTIAFFDKKGDRMHTIYTAASPEYGKETFLKKFTREIDRVVKQYPKVPLIGLADGAASNWTFLKPKVDILTIDFWHVSEYLSKAATAMYPRKSQNDERWEWLDSTCHRMKHKVGGATRILNELKEHRDIEKMSEKNRTTLNATITYLANNKDKMAYHKNVASNRPIGSGVTEAACKTLVKQRMCKGSAKWKDTGATVVLTLRCLHTTGKRWDQFWKKYVQYGCYEVA